MSRSAAFQEHLEGLGIWFPAGDGDALRTAASGWTETAEFLEDIGAVLTQAAANITDNYRGEAAERFFELWQSWDGDEGYMATTAQACRRLGASLHDFGGDVDRADETLLGLIEEAIELRQEAALTRADPRLADDWLRDAAGQLADGLGGQVEARTGALGEVAALPAELAPIDPGQVDWVSPGDMTDLTMLATDTVDFGAGPGTHAAGANVDVPLPDAPTDPLDPAADRGAAVEIPPVELPEEWAGGTGGGGGGFAGGSGGGFDASAFELPSYDQPELEVPELDVPAAESSAFDPLSSGPLAAGAAGAAGVTAAAAAKAGRSSPMMPFMPMGAGGVGGDDGKEPTRRRRRVVVVPPIA